MEQILEQWYLLPGLAVLLTSILGLLKNAGVVKDGDSAKWSFAFQWIGVAVLGGLKLFDVPVDFATIDSVAGALDEILKLILLIAGNFGMTKGAYVLLRGAPGVGFTYSS